MNKWIFWAGIFTIMINFSSWIIPLFVPGIDTFGAMGVPSYQKDLTQNYETFANNTQSNAESSMTDKGNLIYRVLDMINIGFIKAFSLVIAAKDVLYGFPKLMMAVTGPFFNEEQFNAISYSLYTVFSIAYGLFIFGLWSGRDMAE
jgi:hypothetical protein